MYSVVKFQIRQGNEFFDYCDHLTKAANNLYNAALFRVRQVLTFTNKPQSQWTANEWEVFHELESVASDEPGIETSALSDAISRKDIPELYVFEYLAPCDQQSGLYFGEYFCTHSADDPQKGRGKHEIFLRCNPRIQ